MANIAPASRSRVRTYRSGRRRLECEENLLQLDLCKGSLSENIHQILCKLVLDDDIPKASRLASLNCFTRLCSRLTSHPEDLGYTDEDIFRCLQVALLDEAYEVRAAGLRAMRHFLRNPASVRSFLCTNQIHLVIRSLDINLDNKIERLQSLRLIRHLIAVLPSEFPISAARALVAIARDGIQERDLLTKCCWATLAELCLQNPSISAAAGSFSAILDAILQPNVPWAISESLIGTIVFTLNQSISRDHLRHDQDLQHFVAAFTDCYTIPPVVPSVNPDHHFETIEQRSMKFVAAKRAIITIMRSWPSLIFFCRYSDNSDRGSNAIQSLIETLHMPYEESRRNVIDLLYELLNLRMPPISVGDAEEFSFEILSSIHSWSAQDSWHIFDGFVAAEGKSLLPHTSRSRINLFENYLSIVLYTLISYGVVEALIHVITTPRSSMFRNSVLATILLGEILHLSSRLLPHEVYSKCHSLPDLVNAATSPSNSLELRGIASTAVSALERIHILRKTPYVPFSLYLAQTVRFVNLSTLAHHNEALNRFHLKHSVDHESGEMITNYMRDSNVLTHDSRSYNWSLIINILSRSHSCRHVEDDPSYRTFIGKLLNFFKPSSKLFSQVDANDDHAQEMALACCHFVEFLLEVEDMRTSEFLSEFLKDLTHCFSQISQPNAPPNVILSATKLMTTMSHCYFLVTGRMTSSSKGSKLLEKYGIYQHMSNLVGLSCHDVYAKLLISSLDYTRDGFTRKILTKCLTSGSESSKLYATNFMLVLLRAGVADFHKWAIELLCNQLYDETDSVSLAASEVLLESCDQEQNLEALISLKPSLLHTKHHGLLIQIRFASLPTGIKYMTETGVLEPLIDEWRTTHNLRYVRIVEDVMNEALTTHFRSESGTYGRRTEKKMIENNNFLPPHLYGQLTCTEMGVKLLTNSNCLTPTLNTIRSQDMSSSRKLLEMKAGLWAIGNIASTPRGLSLITESECDIFGLIVRMAANCDVLSVRGTCVYVLGMIAMTRRGIVLLKHFGWQGLKHGRGDAWPLVPDCEAGPELLKNIFHCFKRTNYSESVCSSIGNRPAGRPSCGQQEEHDFTATEGTNNSVQPDSDRSRTSSLGLYLNPQSIHGEDEEDLEHHPPTTENSQSVLKIPKTIITVDKETSQNLEGKSRSSSYNNDFSIVSSGISLSSASGASGQTFGKSFPKLSPIASISTSSTTYPVRRSPSPREFEVCDSLVDDHSHHQALDSIPSSTDLQGYATLRNTLRSISRHRVHSMGFQSPTVVGPAIQDCPSSLSSSCSSFDIRSYDENDIFSDSRTFFSSLNLSFGKFSDPLLPIEVEDIESDDPTRKGESGTYIGIVVPICLSLLFDPPISSSKDPYEPLSLSASDTASDDTPCYRTHMDVQPPESFSDNEGLELHNINNCILHHHFEKNDVQSGASGSWMGDEHIVNRSPLERPIPQQLASLRHIVSTSSVTSASSAEGVNPPDSMTDHFLVRREVLRFVTNLSGSVAAKAAEQGMLNLKQRLPHGFQDVCLYSEICLQLAAYNFRLSARKFLQEIFQDLRFDQLRQQAKEIVKKKAPPHNPLHEVEDEVHVEHVISTTESR